MPEQISSEVSSVQGAVEKIRRFVDTLEARGIAPASADADELDHEIGFSAALEEIKSFFKSKRSDG